MNKNQTRIEDTQALARDILASQANHTQLDGWVVIGSSGHTPQTYESDSVRPGRDTAVGYVLNRLVAAKPDAGDPLMLDRLLSLVDEDPESETCGCMRWYAEESQVADTNAAFFSVFPLAALVAVRPDLVPADDVLRMKELFRQTLPWFADECRNPRLYYPNKIISDGAMLLAIGTVLGDEAAVHTAVEFLHTWSTYTRERGWGWGENLSLGYQRVILIALRFAIDLARTSDGALADALAEYEAEILAEAAFHDGAEFVPTIRSYNFSGALRKSSFSYALLGHPASRFEQLAREPGQAWAKTLALLLFPDELAGTHYTPPSVPRERTRRIFENATATSWVGQGVRLGTLSRFPVMPDHYQQDGWGLGWQSFPVTAALDDTGVCALYWYARTGDTVTTHPYYGKDGLQRNYVIAGRRPYPAVATHAAQRGGLAIVVRTISRIHDAPIEFADQWVFRNGYGRVVEHGQWFVQYSGGAALAVRPLSRFRSGSDSLEPAGPTTHPLGEDLAVRVLLHSPEAGPLSADRLEAAWIVVARDDVTDPAQLVENLDTLQITDDAHYDLSLPRMNYAYTRAISVTDPAAGAPDPVALHVDYHADLWR